MEIVKPIAALLADADQGPFRTLIVDSIIGSNFQIFSQLIIISTLSSGVQWKRRTL
jgi:hypothetical protein